jgi:hypothetical protein
VSAEVDRTFEHILKLQPGDDADIALRFALGDAASINIALAGIDLVAGTAELVIEDMWGPYEMQQFAPESGRWIPIWPGDDGDVHISVRFGRSEHLAISSDLAYVHSLGLISVSWERGTLRLAFLETA